MANMLKFLKRKIRPFKKCTTNPSYSFEAVDGPSTPVKPEFNTFMQTKKETKKASSFFHFNRRTRSNKKGSISSSDMMSTNNSLQNREATNSIVMTTNCEDVDENGIDTGDEMMMARTFETPTSSMNSNLINRFSYDSNRGEWESQSYSDDMYSDQDCIQDLIDHTNQVLSPGQNSMVTYNTHKFADNSQLYRDEDGLKDSISLQQSTPFDELESSFGHKRRSMAMSESVELSGFKKSKTFQNQNQLLMVKQCDSPGYKKMDLKKNRKCRRSNTTFTMAGMRKNKIIEYFNNLELNKQISKAHSNRDIALYKPINLEKEVETSIDDSSLSQSKTENEKIQDLFFYDESLMSNQNNSESRIDANLTVDSVSVNVLSTFLDSPVSDKSITPKFCQQLENKLMQKIQQEVTSTNNSVERLRRSNSMPGLNEPDLSIQANNSKINAHKDIEDILTPKKFLNFDNHSNTLETPGTPAGHYISSFEVCDDEPSTFMRGQTRNLSKNIKKMFKNVIKLQLDALASLEKFYEAQLVKVEADRRQNLDANPSNKKKINEFFDKQLELLEERVQVNLENINRDRQRKMTSGSSLKFEQDDSIEKVAKGDIDVQKNLFSQKLAQIITSNQNHCGINNRRTSNLMELKNNLISQKNLLPSKVINQSVGNDNSPKNPAGFKRNLSLPFKQCRQNYQRVRNESVHEAMHVAKKSVFVSSPPKIQARDGKKFNECEFSYNKNPVKAHEITSITQRCLVTNNLAKIVKLNKHTFAISSNSAFKPYQKTFESTTTSCMKTSQLIANNSDAYEEISDIFIPSDLDIRRNSSVFYKQDMNSDFNMRQPVPLPRLSDSHLLFRIKQEKRMNDKKIMSTYQKHFQSKRQMPNFGHVETEV